MDFVVAAVVLGFPVMLYALLFTGPRRHSAETSRQDEGKAERRAA